MWGLGVRGHGVHTTESGTTPPPPAGDRGHKGQTPRRQAWLHPLLLCDLAQLPPPLCALVETKVVMNLTGCHRMKASQCVKRLLASPCRNKLYPRRCCFGRPGAFASCWVGGCFPEGRVWMLGRPLAVAAGLFLCSALILIGRAGVSSLSSYRLSPRLSLST